jgi:hypothetical protein
MVEAGTSVTRKVRWVLSPQKTGRKPRLKVQSSLSREADDETATASKRTQVQPEAELTVAKICDLILKRLNRIAALPVDGSSIVSIQSSAPVTEEAESQALKDVQEANRQWLLQRLRQILEIAMQRVTNPKTPASDRIKWSRIVIAAAQATNAVLRDVEIDALKQQIADLKELTLARLGEDKDLEPNEDQRD